MMKSRFLLLSLLFASTTFAAEIPSQNVEEKSVVSVDGIRANSQSSTLISNWQSKTQEVLINALNLTGIKYTYGGSTPETGFDCSGFVAYVFSQAARLTLPHNALALSQLGITVQKNELQPGDLVFFNTIKDTISHVGIYLGNRRFIHAPKPGALVRIESLNTHYWASRYESGKRLDNEVEKLNSSVQLSVNNI